MAEQPLAVGIGQKRECLCGIIAQEVSDLAILRVAVDVFSQPDVDRSVRVSHVVPHPRPELGVVGGQIVMGLAIGPRGVIDGGCLAYPA